ncbi:MAG: DJ-1/PfpI family protein [Saprospiraceae bacterium]|nr:DJ-1/PfpI family protein [Saprospiraceae bacterium]
MLCLSPAIFSQTATEDIAYICPPCGDGSCDNRLFEKPGTCPDCGMTLIKRSQLKNVAIFIHEGVEVLDFSGPSEVFAATHTDQGAFNVYTVSLTTDPIISQGFIKILPEYALDNAPKPDIIVLPGGNTGAVRDNEKLLKWIQDLAPDLDIALSVCTGAFILQRAGLLDGLKATTWHGAIENFRQTATNTEVLENIRWVDNGKIITTAGVSAGIDGALHVVEKLFGPEAAHATARYMEYDKWVPEDGLIVERN